MDDSRRSSPRSPIPRGLQPAFWVASALVLDTFQIIGGHVRGPGLVVVPIVWGTLGYAVSSVLLKLGARARVQERPLPATIALGLAGILVATIAVAGALTGFGLALGGRFEPRQTANVVLIVASTFAAWSTAALMVAQLSRAHEAEGRMLVAQSIAAGARLRMLRHQLNPHFLFNSLNSLAATIDEDRDRAQRLLVDLSSLLRDALADDSDDGTLGEELDRVERYLRIERARFEGKLHVEASVPDELRVVPCLPLLLQPLVENAIKHGGAGSAVEVRLEAVREHGRIRIQISNPVRVGSPPGSGVGLANVRERLAVRYGAQHRFAQQQRGDGWMEVELGWPLEPGP
jgi:signal transduction histidine kinase